MIYLLPISFLVISVAGMITILVRKLSVARSATTPVPAEGEAAVGGFFKTMFREFFALWGNVSLNIVRSIVISVYEKTLRRVRIVLLKLENKASKWLAELPRPHEKVIVKKEVLVAKEKKEENGARDIVPTSTKEGNSMAASQTAVNGELQREEKRLIEEILKFPQNAELYRRLGMLYLKHNNKDDAEEALRASLEIDSSNESTRKIFDELVRSKN